MLYSLDEYYMELAFQEAQKALTKSEVPIGAVLVGSRMILGRAHNMVETLKDATAHAEILVISSGSNYLQSKNLMQTNLYVTVEPCIMCLGAILHARIRRLIFACENPKYGYSNKLKTPQYLEIRQGILAEKSRALMQEFFKQKRNSNN